MVYTGTFARYIAIAAEKQFEWVPTSEAEKLRQYSAHAYDSRGNIPGGRLLGEEKGSNQEHCAGMTDWHVCMAKDVVMTKGGSDLWCLVEVSFNVASNLVPQGELAVTRRHFSWVS
eukprot:10740518-Ditylum_brightwellii.AAC.1